MSGSAVLGRSQIKLFVMGSPKAGNDDFNKFMTERVAERYNIRTRSDPVTAGPSSYGFSQFLPLIW